MLRKLTTILIVVLSTIAFADLAWPSVEGTWIMQGKLSVTVRIPGAGAGTAKSNFEDTFEFQPGGFFTMKNWHRIGVVANDTWTQIKNKFTVNLDSQAVADYWEWVLNSQGYDVAVTPQTFAFTGTEQKDGTLKGKLKAKMNIFFNATRKNGSATISATFVGARAIGAVISSVEEDDLLPGTELLIDAIEALVESATPDDESIEP